MTVKIEGYITVNEIAELLQVSRSTLYALIQRGKFPAGVKIGHSRRWHVRELNEYLASVSQGGTTE